MIGLYPEAGWETVTALFLPETTDSLFLRLRPSENTPRARQRERLVACGPTMSDDWQRKHRKHCKAHPAAKKCCSTQIAPVAIYPERNAFQLVEQCSQRLWCVRDCVQTLRQNQIQQRTPFAFGQAGEFIHHSFSERIRGPEEFRILLRPRAAEDVGGIETGISRRDEVLGLRHELWPPFEARLVSQPQHTSPCCLARVTGVMSLDDVSARVCPRG